MQAAYEELAAASAASAAALKSLAAGHGAMSRAMSHLSTLVKYIEVGRSEFVYMQETRARVSLDAGARVDDILGRNCMGLLESQEFFYSQVFACSLLDSY